VGYAIGNLVGCSWLKTSKVVTCSSTTGLIAGNTISSVNLCAYTSISFASVTNLVTIVGHTLVNGQQIAFTNLTTVTGILTYIPYYVINVSGDTFQLALTPSGTPVTINASGTSTSGIIQATVASVDTLTQFTLDVFPATTNSGALSYSTVNHIKAQQNGFILS
jgi:hypothetical protein